MTIRIVGVGLPQDERGEVALTYIYSIGRNSAAYILDAARVDRNIKVQNWTDDQTTIIHEQISSGCRVKGDLRSEEQLSIERLMNIGCYRGIRHHIGLPLCGQNTKNNTRTREGKRKTVAGKKKTTK